jgi:hypothetical protein
LNSSSANFAKFKRGNCCSSIWFSSRPLWTEANYRIGFVWYNTTMYMVCGCVYVELNLSFLAQSKDRV